jgi:hypothetical protein
VKQGFAIWLRQNLLPFLLIGVGAFGGAKMLVLTTQSAWLTALSLLLGVAVYAVASWFMLSVSLRADLMGATKRLVLR